MIQIFFAVNVDYNYYLILWQIVSFCWILVSNKYNWFFCWLQVALWYIYFCVFCFEFKQLILLPFFMLDLVLIFGFSHKIYIIFFSHFIGIIDFCMHLFVHSFCLNAIDIKICLHFIYCIFQQLYLTLLIKTVGMLYNTCFYHLSLFFSFVILCKCNSHLLPSLWINEPFWFQLWIFTV